MAQQPNTSYTKTMICPLRARELSKPSKDGESLVVCNNNNCFGCRFFLYAYMMGICLCISG